MYTRCADLVGLLNDLPLLLVELKTHVRNLNHAYAGNLSGYRHTIPRLFWHNDLIILF